MHDAADNAPIINAMCPRLVGWQQRLNRRPRRIIKPEGVVHCRLH
jgi:hypothetical protein